MNTLKHISHLTLLLTSFLLAVSCKKGPEPIPVTGISLNMSSAHMFEGESIAVEATISPANADNPRVLWSSTDGSIASVSDGSVTAHAEGSAVITAKSEECGMIASCVVTVKKRDVPVSDILLNATSVKMEVGETSSLKCIVIPTEATNQKVVWKTSAPSIVYVDQYGVLTALRCGESTVTAVSDDGGKTASCKITVGTSVNAVDAVTLDQSALSLLEGDCAVLTAIVTPSSATNKTVIWSSSNSSVADVDQNGKVTAKKAGEATITAMTENGGKTATCIVTVYAKSVPVSSVTLDRSSVTLKEGEYTTLNASVLPANATNQKLIWSSSNSSVADVDQNGKVTALKSGSAVVTVNTEDGGKTASCQVTVSSSTIKDTQAPKLESFTFTPETIDITDGSQTVTFTAHITDDSGLASLPRVSLSSPSGSYSNNYTMARISGDAKDGVYSVAVSVPQGKEPGQWSVSMWPISDIGNFSTSFLYPTSSVKKLTVIMTKEIDMVAPKLESFTFTPETIDITDGPQTVTFTAHITDDSGLASLPRVSLSSPSGSYSKSYTMARTSGDAKDGVYSVVVSVPQGKEPGQWDISMWPISDIGNFSTSFLYPTSSVKKLTVISN